MAGELVRTFAWDYKRRESPSPVAGTPRGYDEFLEAEHERIDLARIGRGLDPVYVAPGAGCPVGPVELERDRAEMIGEGVKR